MSHVTTGKEIAYAGRHLLIDLHGASRLGDLDHIRQACIDAARATGATVLGEHFHHFGEGCGVSGVVLLAESHLSVHSWPEADFAAFDIFVCGDCDPALAIPVLLDRFGGSPEVILHRRGLGVVWQPPVEEALVSA
jgi:S-adenosylmethionine decarboxylase